MKCDIINDLLPLYIDECCSEESSKEVENHLENCEKCKDLYKSLTSKQIESFEEKKPPKRIKKINLFKASLIQSILLFVSFGLITIGVCLEASTPTGFSNGIWALNLVVPSTGFMLSLANWYFLKQYPTAKKFCFFSCLITFSLTLLAFLWTFNHYEYPIAFGIRFSVYGIFLTILFSIISAFSSYGFAKLSGKE